MGISSIPAYMYFGNNIITKQVNLQIHEDNNIIQYFRNKYPSTASTRILNSSGLHETNLCSYLNQALFANVPGQNKQMIFARNYEFYGQHKDSYGTVMTLLTKTASLSGFMTTLFNINYDVTKIMTLNNFQLTLNVNSTKFIGKVRSDTGTWGNSVYNGIGTGAGTISVGLYNSYNQIDIRYMIWPEGIFTTEGVVTSFPSNLSPIEFNITAYTDIDSGYIFAVTVDIDTRDKRGYINIIDSTFTNGTEKFNTKNSGYSEADSINPYAYDGNSGIGGGDGKYDLSSDAGTDIPDLPSISAADLGFVTIYAPTKSQLKDLANFMWSDAFNLATYKKLFADPMESIIGLAIVPVSPSVGGSKNVMFGSIDSGVNMDYVTSQYVKVNCGSVDIDKYVGAFLDYDYTKISIYLPYIGFRELNADDVMGRTISVEYNVDVLTGACAAFISVSGRGVMYSYNGSCITNVPLTANNFSGAIQNAVSAVISGAGVVAGAATGAAPLTAMGVSGLLSSAANTALNSKPQIQRSGNLGGSAGILSVQHPFVIISRPDVSVPNNIQNYIGQCSNITMSLGNCSGFTMVDYIHLHDVAATSDEIAEIESMLKAGVIL